MDTRVQKPGGCVTFDDTTARDLYARAQQPYIELLREAERARQLKGLPRWRFRNHRTLVHRLALILGNTLIAAGQWIRASADQSSSSASAYSHAGQD